MHLLFTLAASVRGTLGVYGLASLSPDKARQWLDLMARCAAFRAELASARLANGHGATRVRTELARFTAFSPNEFLPLSRTLPLRFNGQEVLVVSDGEVAALMDEIPPRLMEPIAGFTASADGEALALEASSPAGHIGFRSPSFPRRMIEAALREPQGAVG